MSYFWEFGRCPHCDWPHHLRTDHRAEKARRWPRREARAAWASIVCANCHKVTIIEEGFGSDA